MMLTNKNILLLILLALLVVSAGVAALAATRAGDDAADEVVFHVSQSGDDDADGLTPESSFRTLERARDQIRKIHRGEPGRRCRVKIAPGRHSRRMPEEAIRAACRPSRSVSHVPARKAAYGTAMSGALLG